MCQIGVVRLKTKFFQLLASINKINVKQFYLIYDEKFSLLILSLYIYSKKEYDDSSLTKSPYRSCPMTGTLWKCSNILHQRVIVWLLIVVKTQGRINHGARAPGPPTLSPPPPQERSCFENDESKFKRSDD